MGAESHMPGLGFGAQHPHFHEAPRVRDVRLDVVGALQVEKLPELVTVVEPFPGGDGDPDPVLDLAQPFLVVRRDGLFEPENVILFEAFPDLDRRGNVEAAVAFDEELHIVPRRFGDLFHTGHGLFEFLFADLLPRLAEGVPLAAGIAVLPDFHGLGGELLRGFGGREPAVHIDRNGVADLAAQQLVNGDVQRLALDVPQGHFHPGQGAHEHGAAPPVGVPVAVVAEGFDVVGIFADEVTFQIVDRRLNGQFPVFQRGFAPAVNTRVGFHLHEDEVGPEGIADKSPECGDLHFFTPRPGRKPGRNPR